MKGLVTSLSLAGSGTKSLAIMLSRLGYDGGHELVGQGVAGSMVDVPDVLRRTFLRNTRYTISDDAPPGYVGDNRFAEEYFKLHAAIFTRGIEHIRREKSYGAAVRAAMVRYLSEDTFFFDFNNHLAPWWPAIQQFDDIDLRMVHTVRDGRFWVQKQVYFSSYAEVGGHYGAVHTQATRYPPPIPGIPYKDPFEAACIYWNCMNRYFMESGVKSFRVEDFNKPATAKAVVKALFPELPAASMKGASLFKADYKLNGEHKKHKAYSQGPTGFPHPDDWSTAQKDTFAAHCGELMDALGYEAY